MLTLSSYTKKETKPTKRNPYYKYGAGKNKHQEQRRAYKGCCDYLTERAVNLILIVCFREIRGNEQNFSFIIFFHPGTLFSSLAFLSSDPVLLSFDLLF